MAEEAVNHFARTFIEIHLYSILFSAIVAAETGLFIGMFSYLAAVHLLAATVYILDIRYTSMARALMNAMLHRFGLAFDPYRGITSQKDYRE